MTKYIVTEQGPIDRHEPGKDVTALYVALVRDRLIAEGYIEAVDDKPQAKRSAKKVMAADDD